MSIGRPIVGSGLRHRRRILAVVGGLAVLLACAAVVVWVVAVRRDATPATAHNGPAAGRDQVVAAAGDISTSGADDSKRTSDRVLSLHPDRVITVGDNQYPDGSLTDFRRYFDKTWGRFKTIIRPAPGHHEYYTDHSAAGYFGYFGSAAVNASEPGCAAACKGYYSFDLGAWHVVALNTNHYLDAARPMLVCAFVACDAGSAQLDWLRQDLAGTTQPCILAYWSDPRWASGTRHGSNPRIGPIWDALYAAHADLAVNGHEHVYERFAKQNPSGRADPLGIREIIAGTGGNDLYPFGVPLPTSQVRGDTSHGILALTLHADSYDWRFLPTEGGFTDSGSARCNAKGPSRLRFAGAESPSTPPSPPGSLGPAEPPRRRVRLRQRRGPGRTPHVPGPR